MVECERIIIIDKGRLKYDGGISNLSHQIAPNKVIGIALGECLECDLSCYGELLPSENGNGSDKKYIQVPAAEAAAITARILQDLPVHDLTIEDPPIESVIERAFQG